MKIVLSNHPVQDGPGKSVFVRLRPLTLSSSIAETHNLASHFIRLWLNGQEFSRPARSRSEIEQLGDGRTLIDDDTLWFSLPNIVGKSELAHPDAPLDLVIDIPSLIEPQTTENSSTAPTPIYIVGPQRCGSTALLWALDCGTRFTAPRSALAEDSVLLEGYLLRQFLAPSLTSRPCSPFGAQFQAPPPSFPTGAFEQGGDMEFALRRLADVVDSTFRHTCSGASAWVDKAPGWEALATAPMFHALFPYGRSIMMTREPVSCVLSIIRLTGLDLYELPDSETSEFIAWGCANWVVGHFLWRTACENGIPKNRTLVVSMNELRSDPERAVNPLQTLLQLNPQERDGLVRHLHGAPVAVHQANRPTIDLRLRFVIEELTSAEAQCWGYERDQATATLPHGYLNQLRNRFQKHVVTMLVRQGLANTMARQIAMWAIGSQPPVGTAAHTLRWFDRPFHFGLGSLLAALLDEVEAQALTPTVEIAPRKAKKIINLKEPTPTPRVAVIGSAPTSNIQKSNPCEDSGDSVERPPSSWRCHEQLDRQWIPFQLYGGQIRGRTVVGLFRDQRGDRSYEWTAEFTGRNRGMLDFRCRFNGHPGHASILVTRRRFFGILRMGHREDRIEGERQGNIVRFTRLLSAGSEQAAHLPFNNENSPPIDQGFDVATLADMATSIDQL